MAWTAPRTWVVSEIVTASHMNTHVRDQLLYLKGQAGAVELEDDLSIIDTLTITSDGSSASAQLDSYRASAFGSPHPVPIGARESRHADAIPIRRSDRPVRRGGPNQ